MNTEKNIFMNGECIELEYMYKCMVFNKINNKNNLP